MEDKDQLPIAIDDDLSEDKLRTLLEFAQERKAELNEVDYKVSFDMASTQDKVELAKDVIAMNNTGSGYILLGVEDDGAPIGLSQEQYDALDPTPLSNKVNEYAIPQEARLRLAKHELFFESEEEPRYFGLLYCLRRRGLPIMMSKDGNYPDPSKPGHHLHAFRKHDVYVRRGAQSKPMQPEDLNRFLDEALDIAKESWMQEVTNIIDSATQVQRLSQQQVSEALLWLDGETFRSVIISYLGSGNTVAIRELAMIAASSAARLWSECQGKERDEAEDLLISRFDAILDKLFLMGVTAVDHDQNYLLEETLRAFARLYALGASDEVLRTEPPSTAFLLWVHPSRAVMLRCYALGTYAIIQDKFAPVWQMADRRVRLASGQEGYLLQDVFVTRRSDVQPFSYFENAPSYVTERVDVLRLLPEESELCTAAVLDFDLLVSYLLWIRKSVRVALFVARYTWRTAPFIRRIIHQKESIAGAGYTDQNFADFLRSVKDVFRGPFFPRWMVDELPEDVRTFLNEHP